MLSLVLPRTIHSGPGAIESLTEVLDFLNLHRVLLVHGPHTAKAGLVKPIADIISDRVAAVFGDSHSPTVIATNDAIVELTRRVKPDGVVAIGGGSAVDAGKCAVHAIGAQLPLVAVPTTFSGAEMTLDAGIVDPVKKIKNQIRGPHLVATSAIYDPEFFKTISEETLAGSSMNAMAHCVEALYTPATSPFIQSLAICGAAQLYSGLTIRFVKGQVEESWNDLLEGAISAGIACGNASIALHHIMCHYVGPALGLSHGGANSLMLPYTMRYNMPAVEGVFARLAHALGAGEQAVDAVDAMERLHRQIRLPTRLGPLGLTQDIAHAISGHVVNHPRMKNNPRPVSRDDVERILWSAV